jgi:hypothetical protein
MAIVAPVLTQMVVDGFLSRPQPPAALRKPDIVLAIVSVFTLLMAVVFGLIALNLYALSVMTAPLAALVTAGAALSLCVVGVVTLAIRRKAAKAATPIKLAGMDIPESLQAALDAAGDTLDDLVAENPATATALAGLAGYIVAQKMHH